MKIKYDEMLTTCANWVIRFVGGAIFLVLTRYAFRFTQYMIPMTGYEYPVDMGDSELWNLVGLLVFGGAAVLLKTLDRRLSEHAKIWIERSVLGIIMIWQGIWGFLWVASADRWPTGDQGSIYYSALGFLQGEYGALQSGSYCGLFPHQLGLAALEEGLFRLTGMTDYHLLQYIFVGMTVLQTVFLYSMLREMTRDFTWIVLGTVLEGLSMAPVFYSSWIYGETPYVFFAMLAAWMLAAYAKKGQTRYLICFVAAVTMAMLVRENALILITAFALVAVVRGIVKKDLRLLIAIACAFLLPVLCYQGIFGMYERRSGIAHSDGMPSNDYVYIGLMETEGRYGWDYYPSTQVYYDNDTDSERTKAAVDELLAIRWSEMTAERGYLFRFFKGKVLSQWNAPLYQSLYFTFAHEDVHLERAADFLDSLSTDRFFRVLWLADRIQFVLYLGMLCYFVFAVRKNSDTLGHLLAVTIIGGFLFSVIWEAKTRYIFPYYMMMFPTAVVGYAEMAKWAAQRMRNTKGK